MLFEVLMFVFFADIGFLFTFFLSPIFSSLLILYFASIGMKDPIAWAGLLSGFGYATILWMDIADVDIPIPPKLREILAKIVRNGKRDTARDSI